MTTLGMVPRGNRYTRPDIGPISVMTPPFDTVDSYPPEKFVVEVFSELDQDTIQQRWREINVLLRLSMLSGLEMHPEATLNLLCDFAAEIVSFERAIVYFWEESLEQVQACVARGLEGVAPETYVRGNILNFWATKYSRPLLVQVGHNVQADAFLGSIQSACALVLPLLVSNRVMGSLQLFAAAETFTREDAQLLWIISLVAENMLTRESAHEGLMRFAFTDFLTGLKTRGYFEQQLELEIKRSERKKQRFALLMIDIDRFKMLNDRHGHRVGDQILRDVASILIKDMREVDTVARYGGDEFVIILPETSGSGALFVAQRLRKAVEQAKFFAGSPNQVELLSLSIGIAVFDTDAQFRRDLIEFADAALYAAKSQGRNQVVLYSDLVQRLRKEAS
jgi:diguanylate cyclase (GGDEF)-like protein